MDRRGHSIAPLFYQMTLPLASSFVVPGPDRYRFLDGRAKLTPILEPERLRVSLAAAGEWLEAGSEAAIAAVGKGGLCYRSGLFNEDGSVEWLFPRSNTSELITAWLDLANLLGDERYRARAVAYADQYVTDPVHGLYRGEHTEAHGLAWYWRDDKTYTGGYSMRAPESLLHLARVTGEERYLDAARMIGETFLARQQQKGLVSMVGWSPKGGWGHPDMIGSRYVYTVGTFASLYEITSDGRYRAAYEKSLAALMEMQQPDGSFFQNYHPITLAVSEPSVKTHFYSYIFNGIIEAYRVFHDERLVDRARRMALHFAEHYFYRQNMPYCLYPHWKTDLAEYDAPVHDSANGMLWLHEVTGEPLWRDIGQKLWLQGWMTQADLPDQPGIHGALLRGVSPDIATGKAPNNSDAAHLVCNPARVARADLWFQVNYIFATRRLLSTVAQ